MPRHTWQRCRTHARRRTSLLNRDRLARPPQRDRYDLPQYPRRFVPARLTPDQPPDWSRFRCSCGNPSVGSRSDQLPGRPHTRLTGCLLLRQIALDLFVDGLHFLLVFFLSLPALLSDERAQGVWRDVILL